MNMKNITKGSNGREGKENTASLDNLDDEIIDAQEEDVTSVSTHNNSSFSDESIEVRSISSSEFSDHYVLSSSKDKQNEGCIDDNKQSNDDNEIGQ